MSNKINITPEEQKKINSICDYLFFDQYSEMATYMRFERCFQPLFIEDKNLVLEELFKEICGPKKKYLNYKRFVKAYLNYKSNKVSKELKEFFDKLFNSILKEGQIGEFEGGRLTYSTRRANKNRECITMIEVLDDKEGVIHGINVTFDGIFKNKLYPQKLEKSLSVGLEISLKLLDEKKLEKRALMKYIHDSYFRDAITHVFGTVDEKTNFVTFLGFKCISGKTQFVGTPKGKSFLIGEFGKRMNQLKCQMTLDGITCILPYLDQNYRPNVYLSKRIANLTMDDINRDELILDERYLSKLKDKEEIDKYITTALIDDAHFFNFDLKDDIYGNSLKEVIRKQPKRWMRERMDRQRMYPRPRRFFSLNDFMLKFDEEHRRRGRFFMDPRFGLLDMRRMHRRRRLFGFGPHMFHFGPHGPFPRHFSPFGPRPPFPYFGPMPPSMRPLSHPPHMPFGPHHPHFMPPFAFPHGPEHPYMAPPHHPFGPHHFFPSPYFPQERPLSFYPEFPSPFGPRKISYPHLFSNYPRFNYNQTENNYYDDFGYEFDRDYYLNEGRGDREQRRDIIYRQNLNADAGKNVSKIGIKFKGSNQKYKTDDNLYLNQQYDNYDYGYDFQQDYDYYEDDNVYDNQEYLYNQKVNYHTTPNIKQITSKIPAKYLRKDLLQPSNYITHQTVPCRPQKKIIEEEECEQEPQNYIEPKIEQEQVPELEQEQIQQPYEEQQQYEEQAQYEEQQHVEPEPQQYEDQQQMEQQGQIEQEQYDAQQQMEEQQQQEEQIQYEAQQQLEAQQQPEEQIQYEEQIQTEIKEGEQQEIKAGAEAQQKAEEEQNPEGDDEDILIPDEHPEENTSLEELDEQLESLKKLLEDENLKEEERKKLLKLQKLYTHQKNILLDNAEEKEKAELLKKSDIKLDEYIKEEQEKRQKEEEDVEKLIEKEIDKNLDKTEAKIISITTARNPSKIFRRQQIYTGEKPWTDPMFTPCKDNLCPSNEKGWLLPENVLFTDVDGWEKYNWSRVEDILNSKNYQVFEDGISPDDIIQGSIGDCYFLSAVGSLCKFSHYIDRLFLTKERTKEHLYGVFIFLNATWKLVIIDDFLPYTGKKFKKFAFSSSGGKELWVALLEKAWAKINGNYAKIGCGGSPTEVFDVLTEAYTEQVQIHPYYKDYIWETMINSEKNGYIMTAGTSADIVNLNLDEVGLSPGHAYTVLGVLEIDTGKEIEKVVHLRNPYGNGEFNGDWSDYSKKWTPELKKKYNLVIKDDGDFYMAFDDFLNYYITLGVCKLHPGYKTTTIKIKNPTQCRITKVTVNEGEVHSFLQIYQKNPRVPLKDGSKPKLVYNFLMLLDENFNYIYSVSNSNMHNGIEQNLKQGTYYLVSDVNYRYSNKNNKKNFSYVITCYSKIALNLEDVTSNFDLTNIIQTAVYSYCRAYVPPTKCSNGVYLYRAATNMDSIPFETAIFENYTDKDYKVKLNIVGKGEKSFCFYADEIATENDITMIKELPKNSVAVFTALKYSTSSIFNFKYFFAPLKSPNPNNPTALKAPKIYPEKPVLQPAQPTTDANAPQAQVQVQTESQAQPQVQVQQQYIQPINEINTQEQKTEIIQQQNNNINNQTIQTTVKTEITTITKEEKGQNVPIVQTEIKTTKVEEQKIIPKQTQVNVVKKKGGHPVFKTQGQIIDENGVLVQYYLDNGEEFVIGLENRSNMKVKMQLILEGLVIANNGKSYAIFYSNPRERKIFKTKKIANFNGQIAFEFQYA